MSKYVGKYTATELLSTEFKGTNPLIQNLIYERDNVLLVGKEKANKSTLALQMCCHMTSNQEPFLGEHEIPKSIDVVYLQAEGKIAQTQSNLRNMTKVIPCNSEKLLFLYYPSIPLNTETGLQTVINEIDSWRRPDLIVIDPLYQTMIGKIEDQESSSKMTASLRTLSEHYQSTILLLHHAHRVKRDDNNNIIEEGDDSIFGSFVWKAFPDSVLLIEKVRGNKLQRRLSCNTQRMGNVIESIDLQLIEPSPFYLDVRGAPPCVDLVYHNLNGDTSMKDLIIATGKSRQTVTSAINTLIGQNKATRKNPGENPAIWTKQ